MCTSIVSAARRKNGLLTGVRYVVMLAPQENMVHGDRLLSDQSSYFSRPQTSAH